MKFARNKFGMPGVIAVCALVFAMLGGAYAASDGGGNGATASAKAKKGPRGPRGPRGLKGATGAPGAPGAQGAKGDAGAAGQNGAPGEKGATGTTGTAGTAGKSVVVTDADEVTECVDVGGVMVEKESEPASAKEVCNGEDGAIGPTGPTGPLTSELPKGITESGTWSFNGAGNGEAYVPINFPFQVGGPSGPSGTGLPGTKVFIGTPGSKPECTGNVQAPTAPAETLCVYVVEFSGAKLEGVFKLDLGAKGTNRSGALIYFTGTTAASYGYGSWAVTG